jgi:hypothetical protein
MELSGMVFVPVSAAPAPPMPSARVAATSALVRTDLGIAKVLLQNVALDE